MTIALEERDFDAEIGGRVHQMMWQRRVTQTALGPKLGISQSVLGRKLRGVVSWSARDVAAVADALQVSAAYLMGETENPHPGGKGPGGGSDLCATGDSNPEPAD